MVALDLRVFRSFGSLIYSDKRKRIRVCSLYALFSPTKHTLSLKPFFFFSKLSDLGQESKENPRKGAITEE